MEALFHWLDGDPVRYRAGIVIGFVVCAALTAARMRWKNVVTGRVIFAFALFVALFLIRWPVVLDGRRLGNPDEPLHVSDALTYAHDPMPFRSVDTTTSGPLASFSLMVFSRVICRPIDFVTTRLFGLLCLWVLVVCLWRALTAVTDETRARLLALPAILVLGWEGVDLTQFNNEQPSGAALGLAVWALAPLCSDERTLPRWRLLVGALLIGAAPFVKPQAAPMTLWLAMVGGWLLWRHAPSRDRRVGNGIVYALGGVATAAVLAGCCVANGLWDDVTRTFFSNNLQYTAHRHFPWYRGLHAVHGLAREVGPPLALFWVSLGGLAAGLGLVRGMRPDLRRLFVLAAGFLLAALLAIAAPGKEFMHYIFYLLFPASLLLAVVTLAGWEQAAVLPAGVQRRGALGAVGALWVAFVLAPVPVLYGRALPYRLGDFGGVDPEEEKVRAAVARYSPEGDGIAVWGWAPWIYVWAQKWHATREGITPRQIEMWGDIEWYRERFVRDLQRTRPVLFIDSVGPACFGYRDIAREGHEVATPVARYIATHYVPAGTVENLRFYVRRDRAPAELTATYEPLLQTLTMATPRPTFRGGLAPEAMGYGDGALVLSAHAPSQLGWAPSAKARRVRFVFGLPAAATQGDNRSDGVEFRVFTIDFATGEERVLFSQLVQPLDHPADRGEHRGEVVVPPGVSVVFETAPGPARNNSWDWSYWRSIAFEDAP